MSYFNAGAVELSYAHFRTMTYVLTYNTLSGTGIRKDNDLQPVYLVLERDALISADLAASLHALGPCRVINVTNPDCIGRALEGEERLDAAFLEMTYASFVERGLEDKLSAYGARAIFTVGEDDELAVRAKGWGMLVRPFNEQMIWDSLSYNSDVA